MLETLLETLGSSVTATMAVFMLYFFLKHLKYLKQKDIEIHKQCEDTITNIVTKHEDSQKMLIEAFKAEK